MVTINKIQLQNVVDRLNDRLADAEARETHQAPSSPMLRPTSVATVPAVVHVNADDLALRERLAYLEAEHARLKAAVQARRVSAAMRRKYDFDQVPVNGHIEVELSEAANMRSCLAGAKAGYLKGRDTEWITKTIADKVWCVRLK